MVINNIKVEMLTKEESTKYLGQMATFHQQETLGAAWAAFYKYRQELTSESYSLQHRLRLFNMVITPTMNCAACTWTFFQKNTKE